MSLHGSSEKSEEEVLSLRSPFGSEKAGKSASSFTKASQINFIEVAGGDDDAGTTELSSWSKLTRSIVIYLNSKQGILNGVLGLVILIDVIASCVAVDANASGSATPQIISVISVCCLFVYVSELSCAIYRGGRTVFSDSWIQLDTIVVLGGSVDMVVELLPGESDSNLGLLRILRMLRIVRLITLLRKVTALKELRKLAKMLLGCVKTLMWSFVFCGVCMTFWAMLAVDLIHPLMEETMSHSCPDCAGAFSSVMRANLTLFKTIIAGDSWGVIAEPMITAYPLTAIVFMGSQLTIVFGVLNLVVAAVVDEFAEQRMNDITSVAQDMDDQMSQDLQKLAKMFRQMDLDHSGELSLEELLQGASRLPDFRNRLRVMDIDKDDLEQLFIMLDQDRSGFISQDEFKGALSRWLQESKTASRFTKHNVQQTMARQDELMNFMQQRLDQLERTFRSQSDLVSDAARSAVLSELAQEGRESLESMAAPNLEAQLRGVVAPPDGQRFEMPTSPGLTSPDSLLASMDQTVKSAKVSLEACLEATRLVLRETAEPILKEGVSALQQQVRDMEFRHFDISDDNNLFVNLNAETEAFGVHCSRSTPLQNELHLPPPSKRHDPERACNTVEIRK